MSCDACDASTYLERYARDVYKGTKRHKRHTVAIKVGRGVGLMGLAQRMLAAATLWKEAPGYPTAGRDETHPTLVALPHDWP